MISEIVNTIRARWNPALEMARTPIRRLY